MKRLAAIGLIACCLSGLSFAQSSTSKSDGGDSHPHSQLDAWIGTWEGSMSNLTTDGSGMPIPVRMTIKRLDNGAYVWRTVYNNDDVMGLRDYRLIPDPDRPGHYVTDEQNGILLRTQLIGNELHSAFSVDAQNLTSTYRIQADTLIHEVAFWSSDDVETTTGTGVAGEDGKPVLSYLVSGIQRSVMTRTK